MPKLKSLAAALVFLCALSPRPAHALSLCSLLCSCTVSTSTLSLGGYNPIGGAATTASGSLSVSCSLLSGIISFLVPYTVLLNSGQSGSFTPRQMTGPTATPLSYNLYSNSALTTIWGDGTGVTQTVSNTITVVTAGLNVLQNATIYAQIPANQNVPIGNYQDTITATVQY